MTNGKKARAFRKANPTPIKEKTVTPWFMRNSVVLRKGRGNESDQLPGTPKSAKKMERLKKFWDRPDPVQEATSYEVA